jgi:hypothetical protein
MPFVSRSQWRQCFAAARRGQRKVSQCKEYASMSKSYKSLPASLADAQRLPERVRKLRRTRRRVHQKATAYDLPASLADAQRLPDEMEEDMDSPYDDFSYDVDDRNDIIDFEIDEAEREYKDYNQMATKKGKRKYIKKRGSKRRYRRQH